MPRTPYQGRGSRDFARPADRSRVHQSRHADRAGHAAPVSHPDNRNIKLSIVFAVLALLAIIAGMRLFWLQVVDAENNLARNGGSGNTERPIPARRGTIYDCNGTILATTVDAINVFVHPHVVDSGDVDKLATFLAEQCGGEEEDYVEKITADANFSWVAKGVDPEVGEMLKELDVEGVDYEKTVKRVYPCGAVGSQVIGMLNSDGEALSGLELYYDELLGGSEGTRIISYSKEGVPIPGSEAVTKEAVPGKDIVVSLDAEMQQEMEMALELNAKDVEADNASGIVMDADTGAIIACSSFPTFDITDTSTIVEGSTTMSGISFTYEPGSVFKPLIMMAALEEGTTKAGQNYYCPAHLQVDGYTISDSHDRGAEDMDTTKIIADSSNVGMSLISKDLGAEKMYEYIQKYKVCEKTGIDYPGEAAGGVKDYKSWSRAQQYNISFGQGLTTTPIGITRFYGAIANGGTAVTPHFLVNVPADGGERSYGSERIIEDTDAIDDLVEMMEHVTTEGTAKSINLGKFDVAGKTGTAQTIQNGSYVHGVYNISFCGFLPKASKNIVCYVGASNVPGMYQTVGAFQDIMSFAIDRYNISQE